MAPGHVHSGGTSQVPDEPEFDAIHWNFGGQLSLAHGTGAHTVPVGHVPHAPAGGMPPVTT
jgi:hypothetical protein